METMYGKTPLTIHAAKPALSKDGGVTLLTAKKSNWAPGETSRGTRGPYATMPSSPELRLIAPKASTLRVQLPYSVVLHSQGGTFNAGFITPDNHKAHSAQFPLAMAFQWPFPIGSHLYWISLKGSYQLVHHANRLGRITCIMGYRA